MSFSRYPKYKDSGVEWLGEVPECWGVTRISRLFNIKAGGDIKEQFFSVNCTEKYCYPIYTNTIKSDVIYGFTSKAFFPGNTITVTGRGDIGYAVYRDHPYDAIIRLLVLTPKNNDSCKYSMYFINSILNFHGGNTAISQLSTEQISPYLILNPPLQEQFAIATFLDRETAKMDALVAEQEKLIAILKEKRQAVISHAVTKGLDPSVPMKDSGVEWLGEVPECWGIKPLKYVVLMKSGDQITAEDINESGEYPVFGGNGLRGYVPIYTHDGWFPLIGRQGALCGNVNYAMGKFWASEHAVVVTPQTDCNILWLGELLRTMNLGKYSITAAQPGLSVDVIRNLRIPFPKISEQRTIASFLDRETAKIDSLTAEAERGIVLLKERRSALISAAVTGEIDVRAFLQIPTNAQPWRTHD
ncbi:putative type-1 restriction enzyme specificity protein MPN_089 [Ferrovum myxofaciens]|uniref:Putative type-1 restriction enzyme specificity protein MPN_089 n=1 Tax=Ferrovum myxofaciens TaxID=416213 RepID=A0A149VW98_9PROT|nr:restriction endonuclease subunit S [Ferrovum myxofaciens]KXW57456.1 putative type-1 restriction enzyme specificity protein MPN_089 [Ferrovum myxofaciens]